MGDQLELVRALSAALALLWLTYLCLESLLLFARAGKALSCASGVCEGSWRKRSFNVEFIPSLQYLGALRAIAGWQ
ncbi:hypothetical protein LEMLEM_LOCUS5207 [Lemmus lemmus]